MELSIRGHLDLLAAAGSLPSLRVLRLFAPPIPTYPQDFLIALRVIPSHIVRAGRTVIAAADIGGRGEPPRASMDDRLPLRKVDVVPAVIDTDCLPGSSTS